MSSAVARVWTTQEAAETQALGFALAAAITPPLTIALRGNLGAGKTTFVQGLAAGLGVRSRVSSPTFVLVNEYQGAEDLRLVHVDTYRLGAATDAEAAGMGLEELFEDEHAVVAVEWADRVAELLPPDHLLVELEYGEAVDARSIRISGWGQASAAVVEKLDF
jgi:tRNA threonylcarbamoyladenosine biosynthesis protein TsaE